MKQNNNSNKIKLTPTFIPKSVILNTKQSLGKPSKPVVKEGDIVKEGDVIASPTDFMSTYIHSPIPGKINSIRESNSSSNKTNYQIEINFEGIIESQKKAEDNLDNMSVKEILKRIYSSGIIENKDNNIPIYHLINLSNTLKITTLYTSTIESNIQSNYSKYLLEHKQKEITNGIKILEKILKLRHIYIVTTSSINKALSISYNKYNRKISFLKLRNNSDMYFRKKLNYVLNKKEKKFENINSVTEDSLILSLEDIIIIYEAVLLKKPYTEKIITILTSDNTTPIYTKIKIGIKMIDLLTDIGIDISQYDVYINSKQNINKVNNLNISIGKDIYNLILELKSEEKQTTSKIDDLLISNNKGSAECSACGKCINICPSEINPRLIYNYAKYSNNSYTYEDLKIDFCIECGLCNEVCPSDIDILKKIREVKQGIND